MKKHNFIKRVLVALTFAVAVAVMVPAAGSVEAQAAKKATAQKNWKKAKTVKTGTTVVTVKKCPKKVDYQNAYVKFKAPKAGTYTFTVSSIKVKGEKPADSIVCGFYTLSKLNTSKSALAMQKLKTEGGKSYSMQVGSKSMYDYSKEEGFKKVDQYRTKRTATIKLKKGETVFLDIILTTKKQYTYNLKIKKK